MERVFALSPLKTTPLSKLYTMGKLAGEWVNTLCGLFRSRPTGVLYFLACLRNNTSGEPPNPVVTTRVAPPIIETADNRFPGIPQSDRRRPFVVLRARESSPISSFYRPSDIGKKKTRSLVIQKRPAAASKIRFAVRADIVFYAYRLECRRRARVGNSIFLYVVRERERERCVNIVASR